MATPIKPIKGMTSKSIQILTILGDGIMLGLANCRENMGHDDSLPYQSDVYCIKQDKNGTTKTKLGTIWNDGWGGNSVFNKIPERTDLIDELDALCRKHQMYYRGKPFGEFEIVSTIDSMAECYCAVIADPKASKAIKAKGVSLLWKFDDSPDILSWGDTNRLPVFFYTSLL